jgi:hypothetical protein
MVVLGIYTQEGCKIIVGNVAHVCPENCPTYAEAKFSLEIFYVTVHYRKQNEICHFDATSPYYPNPKSDHLISKGYGHNLLVGIFG